LDPQETALAGGGDPLAPGFGDEAADQYGHIALGLNAPEPVPTRSGCYIDFYRKVAHAILSGGPVPVEPAEAINGLRLLEAARTSAARSQSVAVT
jgi:predicted dehydrogenase